MPVRSRSAGGGRGGVGRDPGSSHIHGLPVLRRCRRVCLCQLCGPDGRRGSLPGLHDQQRRQHRHLIEAIGERRARGLGDAEAELPQRPAEPHQTDIGAGIELDREGAVRADEGLLTRREDHGALLTVDAAALHDDGGAGQDGAVDGPHGAAHDARHTVLQKQKSPPEAGMRRGRPARRRQLRAPRTKKS
ncbi:hypothetical protein SDC9_25150 [bioreactor metagenome]|uniref:Uncharacterized protein n=1 Tax=bioreactor metagenome TaxID=1076179 RepID=A0A644UK11_9ZZZZ